MNSNPQIYFHVGLGKTASTFLQSNVFPKLRDIYYLPTNKYHRYRQLLPKKNDQKILVSREFDVQLEYEIASFVKLYPEAKPIIVFRRHDRWIASQYRRRVKNGWHHDFSRFYNLENTGIWPTAELDYMGKISLLNTYFKHKPLILFHEDLKENPKKFIEDIAGFMGATCDFNEISLKAVHVSYNEKQMRVIKTFCRKYMPFIPGGKVNKIANLLMFRPWWLFFHIILYAALLIPDKWAPNDPLIPDEELEKIKIHFESDWKELKEYASKNNPAKDNPGLIHQKS